jgi:hypothetical protein
MRVVNPKSLELVGVQPNLSLKAKETLLPCFVLLEHKVNGKLLLAPLLLRAHGITMA